MKVVLGEKEGNYWITGALGILLVLLAVSVCVWKKKRMLAYSAFFKISTRFFHLIRETRAKKAEAVSTIHTHTP